MKQVVDADDFVSANLASLDFNQTRMFYSVLGFQCTYQSEEWMILRRLSLILEFFNHPTLDPSSSWHSACIRISNLDGLYKEWSKLNLESFNRSRIGVIQDFGAMRMFCVIDQDGNLLRCIERMVDEV